MPLHRISSLIQKETDRLLKSFMDDNPDLLKKYVNGSLSVIATVLSPVNVFMKHLLTLQGLDPNSVPGEAQRLQLQEGLNKFFSESHDEAFDEDYDLSWVQKRFENTRKQLNQPDMTKDSFLSLTDLARVEDVTKESLDAVVERVNPVAPESPKREVPLDAGFEVIGSDAIEALRKAVEEMEKEIKPSKKKKSSKKTSKKLNKSPGTKVRRTVSTEPVKEAPSTLEVQAGLRPSTKRTPGRDLSQIARERKAQVKAAKEATPKFQAELKAKLLRATELTNLMVAKGLCEVDDKSRQDQINSMLNWADNNFDALERVITKYGPTKDAVAENKFKGSFRRVVK